MDSFDHENNSIDGNDSYLPLFPPSIGSPASTSVSPLCVCLDALDLTSPASSRADFGHNDPVESHDLLEDMNSAACADDSTGPAESSPQGDFYEPFVEHVLCAAYSLDSAVHLSALIRHSPHEEELCRIDPSSANSSPILMGKERLATQLSENRKNLNIFRGLRSIMEQNIVWSCAITVSTSSAVSRTRVEFTSAELMPDYSTNLFFDTFGSHRFLRARVKQSMDVAVNSHSADSDMEMLFDSGIDFLGRHYAFLCAESLDSSEVRSIMVSESTTSREFSAWLFAESDSEGSLRPVLINYVRSWLADFSSHSASKMNARLKLGFSTVIKADLGTIDESNFTIIDDIVSPMGNIMTDGCGFISSTLMMQLPRTVRGGEIRASTECAYTPSVIQVRIRSPSVGLVKGCLIVTSDTVLCPSGGVVIRKSMIKAGPGEVIEGFDSNISFLGIVNTFLDEIDDITSRLSSIRLNRYMVLLLHDLGVSRDIFSRILQNEINLVLGATYSTTGAMKYLLKRWLDCISFLSGNRQDAFIDDSLAAKAMRLILAGCSIDEPYLFYLLRKLQNISFQEMLQGRISLDGGDYFVGIPDPTGLLQPGQVAVCFPRKNSGELQFYAGDVIVSRNPLYHPADLRRLSAIRIPDLESFFLGSSGGMVIFPVQGAVSHAAQMSGGDFDGDMYFVIFSRLIVDSFREAFRPDSAVVDLALNITVDDTSEIKSRNTYCASQLFRGILQEAGMSIVGRFSNAWLAWADEFGPSHEIALCCHEIILLALDSAKTGIMPDVDASLLKCTKPHYIDPKGRKSTGIVGELYDAAEAAAKTLNRFPGLVLDEEIMYRVHKESTFEDAFAHQQTLGALAVRWRGFVNIFKKQLAVIRSSIASVKERSGRIKALLLDYRSKFDSDASDLAAVDCARLKFAIQDRFLYQQYEEYALDASRRRLASLIYCATYSSHTGKEKNYRSLEFCWSVCGSSMLKNKSENRKLISDSLESFTSYSEFRSLVREMCRMEWT